MTAASEHLPLQSREYIQEDEVHVWHFPYDRQLGRQPLFVILSRYLGRAPTQILLTEGEYGRPALAADLEADFDFNWSHSGRHAVIAIARNRLIGVDIEQARPRPKALELAERFFHRDEALMLRSLPTTQQAYRFLELWTAKESILKALGRGIAFGLDRLVVESEIGRPLQLTLLEGDDPDAWQLQSLNLGTELVGALTWRGDPATVRYRLLASAPLETGHATHLLSRR